MAGVALTRAIHATNDFLGSATGRLGYSAFERKLLYLGQRRRHERECLRKTHHRSLKSCSGLDPGPFQTPESGAGGAS